MSAYVCPQCGPSPEGEEAHSYRAHTLDGLLGVPMAPSPKLLTAELADAIAERIFSMGDEPWAKCTRLEFKGRHEVNNIEIGLGGLAREPFTTYVREVLDASALAARVEAAERERNAAITQLEASERDAKRLDWLGQLQPWDEFAGIDIHDKAAEFAEAAGREEPTTGDYSAALRFQIDAGMKEDANGN